MRRLTAILSAAIVIAFGLPTLLGLLIGEDLGLLSTLSELFGLRTLAGLFMQLVVITVALTVIMGILNLLLVHLGRAAGGRRGWPYSSVLILSALLVIALTIAERANLLRAPEGERAATAVVLESVQLSIESALAALLLFTLVYGAYRLMRRGVTWPHVLFTATLLIVLLGALPLPGAGASLLGRISEWLLAVPVSAGARGILLGVALATVVTGLRVLIGQDRSYRE
jgi:hypothetical protein